MNHPDPAQDVTRILEAIEAGNPAASEELLPIVYEDLRRLASHRMAGERPGQTLQATALVHEAWLRLVHDPDARWDSRNHFFKAAAEAMRRILIDRSRRKRRVRHGGELRKVSLEDVTIATETDDDTLLLVHEALDQLAAVNPLGAELVKLRFFAGLPNVEAARLLGLSERTAAGCPGRTGSTTCSSPRTAAAAAGPAAAGSASGDRGHPRPVPRQARQAAGPQRRHARRLQRG